MIAKAEPSIENSLDRPAVIEPRLISVAVAAAALGIGLTECKVIIGRGELRSCKIGSRRLVAVADLDAYVAGLCEGQAR